jgi:pimeloyl-ACP methyl ester carboxylesterase
LEIHFDARKCSTEDYNSGLSEFLPMVIPPPVAAQMSKAFGLVRANPNARGVIGGNSYRWWADILDRRFSDDLLKSDIPVLIVHGQNDRHAPIATAHAARDAFISAGENDRLTYWALPHRDHQMVDEQGNSHLAEVLSKVGSWIMEH